MIGRNGGTADTTGKTATTATATGQLLLVPQRMMGNGAPSCSSSSTSENGLNSTGALPKADLYDCLDQLIKDKKQLAAFPNLFFQLDRLLDEEINRVHMSIFQSESSREPLQLPEPIGEIVVHRVKVFVPVEQLPGVRNIAGQIIGPRGMTVKRLEAETGCEIMVQGRGSMRDNRARPYWWNLEHLKEDLHVLIQSKDTPNRNAVKMARAMEEEVNKLLEGEYEMRRKQLMVMAIMNGTYRTPLTPPSGTFANNNQAAKSAGTSASSLPQLDQRFLLAGSATGLTAAPLILTTPNASQPARNDYGHGNVPIPLASAQSKAAATSKAHQSQQALLQQPREEEEQEKEEKPPKEALPTAAEEVADVQIVGGIMRDYKRLPAIKREGEERRTETVTIEDPNDYGPVPAKKRLMCENTQAVKQELPPPVAGALPNPMQPNGAGAAAVGAPNWWQLPQVPAEPPGRLLRERKRRIDYAER